MDDLILQNQKLGENIWQAEKSLEYFQQRLQKAADDLSNLSATASVAEREKTEAEKRAAEAERKVAEKRLKRAKDEQELYKLTLDERKKNIKDNASKAGVKVKERTAEQILKEERKQGYSNNKFVANLQQKGGMGGKAGIVGGVVDMIGGLFSAGTDIYLAEQRKSLNTWIANQDIYLKTIETTSKIFQRNMKTFSKGMQGAVSSSFASITQGVQEGAYSAATASVDVAAETMTNFYDTTIDKLRLANYEVARQKQLQVENLKETAGQWKSGVGAVSGIVGMFGPVGSVLGGLMSSIAENTTKILTTTSEMELQRLEKLNELSEKELEVMSEAKKSAIAAAQESVSKVLDFSKAIENLSLKTDAAAKSMANIIGMGGYADKYEKFVFGAARNMRFTDSSGETKYLNKNAEDMLKMQSEYAETSTRNNLMSQRDFVKSFLLGETLGDDNLAAMLLGDMDYFNKSIASGTDLIFDMFQAANKAGVSNRKFAKDLQQNLRLASKYTFKGGVKGMMEMSIWAQKTRFNMQNLENMVDSIQDGGLEGVITKAAKLQVLGGDMAMRADPIAMMHEAWADPEALIKRFADMTKGIGYFDSKTGEVEIKGPEAMRLKAYAEAAGINYTDARAQVTQRIKGEQIDRQLTRDYTDEQKALIYNKAKLNENGQWEVNVLDKKTNKIVTKDVNDLTESDWNSLMPVEESIENYVGKIYNLLDQQGGVTNYAQSVLSDETFENLKKNINDRMAENLNWVTESSGTLKSMIEESNNFVTDQNKQQHDLMEATTGILNQEYELIKMGTEKMRLSLSEGGSNLRLALDAVYDELNYELAKLQGADEETLKKLAEKANISNDKLAGANNVRQHELGVDENIKRALEQVASKSTQREFSELKQIHSNINKEHGALTKRNQDKYEDFLDKHTGGQEILNALQDKGVIQHPNTGSLEDDEIIKVNEAIDYFLKNYESLYRLTNGSKVSTTQYASQWGGGYNPNADYTVKDGVVSANGKPIFTQAAQITPIQDGTVQVAQSSPNDKALFAEDNGPFDTLFNGIFGKVNEIHRDIKSGTHSTQPMKLEISGSLDLRSGGQSIDIMNTLKENPLFIRELSRILASQLSKAQNGGRGTMEIGIGSV